MDPFTQPYESIELEDLTPMFVQRRLQAHSISKLHLKARSRSGTQDTPPTDAAGDLREQVQILREDVEWIREAIRTIIQRLDDETLDAPDNHDMTPNEIKDLILAEVGLDKPFYPSDLAEEYGLDLDAVYEAVDILRKDGRVVERD